MGAGWVPLPSIRDTGAKCEPRRRTVILLRRARRIDRLGRSQHWSSYGAGQGAKRCYETWGADIQPSAKPAAHYCPNHLTIFGPR